MQVKRKELIHKVQSPPPCAISFLRVLRPACAGDGGVSWLTYPLMQTGKGRAKWRN
jgi:hypothetical protein